jgi:hypothetical protein
LAKGDDIEERLIVFAVRVIQLSEKLPETPTGRHISGQLLRSGTSNAISFVELLAPVFKQLAAKRRISS